MIVRVGWDFCCAVLEEIFLPGKKTRTPVVHVNIRSSSVAPLRGWKWLFTHHWCLSERPFQSGSVRTIRSISFFHNIPSEMTLCHSLHTSSAEHRERASRKDKMFSAIWSKPWAKKGKRRKNSKGCFKMVNNVTAVALIGVYFYLAMQWWSPSAAWVWGRSLCGRAGSGTYGRSGARQTPPGRPLTTGQTGWCSVPSPSHSFLVMVAYESPLQVR